MGEEEWGGCGGGACKEGEKEGALNVEAKHARKRKGKRRAGVDCKGLGPGEG